MKIPPKDPSKLDKTGNYFPSSQGSPFSEKILKLEDIQASETKTVNASKEVPKRLSQKTQSASSQVLDMVERLDANNAAQCIDVQNATLEDPREINLIDIIKNEENRSLVNEMFGLSDDDTIRTEYKTAGVEPGGIIIIDQKTKKTWTNEFVTDIEMRSRYDYYTTHYKIDDKKVYSLEEFKAALKGDEGETLIKDMIEHAEKAGETQMLFLEKRFFAKARIGHVVGKPGRPIMVIDKVNPHNKVTGTKQVIKKVKSVNTTLETIKQDGQGLKKSNVEFIMESVGNILLRSIFDLLDPDHFLQDHMFDILTSDDLGRCFSYEQIAAHDLTFADQMKDPAIPSEAPDGVSEGVAGLFSSSPLGLGAMLQQNLRPLVVKKGELEMVCLLPMGACGKHGEKASDFEGYLIPIQSSEKNTVSGVFDEGGIRKGDKLYTFPPMEMALLSLLACMTGNYDVFGSAGGNMMFYLCDADLTAHFIGIDPGKVGCKQGMQYKSFTPHGQISNAHLSNKPLTSLVDLSSIGFKNKTALEDVCLPHIMLAMRLIASKAFEDTVKRAFESAITQFSSYGDDVNVTKEILEFQTEFLNKRAEMLDMIKDYENNSFADNLVLDVLDKLSNPTYKSHPVDRKSPLWRAYTARIFKERVETKMRELNADQDEKITYQIKDNQISLQIPESRKKEWESSGFTIEGFIVTMSPLKEVKLKNTGDFFTPKTHYLEMQGHFKEDGSMQEVFHPVHRIPCNERLGRWVKKSANDYVHFKWVGEKPYDRKFPDRLKDFIRDDETKRLGRIGATEEKGFTLTLARYNDLLKKISSVKDAEECLGRILKTSQELIPQENSGSASEEL